MEKNGLQCICEDTVFAGFFKTHVKNLRNYLYYKFGNEEQANDVTQEAFIKLWENCKNVPFEKAKSFLYIVANNASLNYIAHQKVVLEYSKKADLKQHAFESPDYLIEEEEFRVKLHNAIENLSEAQRTAFLLNRIDGKKYAEIADMLGISVKAVEKRISGALVALREQIEQLQGIKI
ncbi:MAG TPA: sigma-70 family RNA polymerase sigma factor [Flavobacterium sp.]|jgi:RNA polymerase sigma-70 factor (family 1)|nr:sigma-70 family RNA polymerase sigma factor [Flavobacterium sp.]HPJ09054.1 sigma-70 family RNA polymerase sigma factor [Flavobacterium sp.]